MKTSDCGAVQKQAHCIAHIRNDAAPSVMMKRWLLLAALAAAEDLAFVREGCRISIHGARAILRDGARECDLWNAARNGGRRCASDKTLLCEVVFADQKAAAATHAALTVATDAAYLAAPIPGGLPRYKYVEAQAARTTAAQGGG